MEEQVPFKVYTFWNQDRNPEVRRFGVEKSVVTSFQYLNAKLQDVYPGLKNKSYSVTWKDGDGDDITISSDEEILIALSNMSSDLIKLNVYCKDGETDQKDECEILFEAFPSGFAGTVGDTKMNGCEHYGVVCDGCDNPVVGFRYKCASCNDFDLCSKCESAGLHPAHCMVRIPVPAMPHAVIKAAIKRSRNFLKSVSVKDETSNKKHKREKSGERKHCRDNEHYRERRERRECRRPRGSWLETFATYMNEFANLAGDVEQPPAAAATAAAATAAAATAAAAAAVNAPKNTDNSPAAGDSQPRNGATTQPGPSQPLIPQIPLDKILTPENVKYLMELQKSFTNMLVPNLVPQEPAKEMSPTPQQQVPINDPRQEDRQSTESEISVKSVASNASNESKVADSSSDKVDDWTMINRENDLMDVAGASPSAPSENLTIGFNLPREFQRHVQINPTQAQNIYPPLNINTAVLNPQQAELPVQQAAATSTAAAAAATVQAQPKPTQTQPEQAQTQPKPVPSQQPRHPKPHIAAAIDNMLAMGFNNDAGWLTQLLENYNGNISAVLDLLTPVNPKKK